jgi:hypothetical protein
MYQTACSEAFVTYVTEIVVLRLILEMQMSWFTKVSPEVALLVAGMFNVQHYVVHD